MRPAVCSRPVVMALQLPRLSFLPASPGPERSLPVSVRPVRRSDTDALAELCTNSFFGEHTFADGPLIFLQRLQILLRVRMQISRRIGLEGDDRECLLVVAEDVQSGQVCGCLDLAVHLYDREQVRPKSRPEPALPPPHVL